MPKKKSFKQQLLEMLDSIDDDEPDDSDDDVITLRGPAAIDRVAGVSTTAFAAGPAGAAAVPDGENGPTLSR